MQTKNIQKKKKNKLKIILYCSFIIIVLYNIIFQLNSELFGNDYIEIFGTIISVAIEDNLVEVPNNSLVFSKKIDNNISENDIVSYKENKKLRFTRIYKINNEEGVTNIVTKNDNSYYVNNNELSNGDLQTKLMFSIPIIGWVFLVLGNKIITILVILMLILRYLYNKEKQRRKDLRNKKRNDYIR